MSLLTKAFWVATTERVVASIAGGFLSVVGAETFGVLEADWRAIASVSIGAGVVSLAKALVANHIGTPGPSLAGEVVIPDPLA